MVVALVAECQNLNSGNLHISFSGTRNEGKGRYRRMNGRNSSSCFVGREPEAPSSESWSASSCSRDGSNFGVRKARNRFSRYIPRE